MTTPADGYQLTGHTFVVTGAYASIDTIGYSGNYVVFGGDHVFSYEGGNTTIVLTGGSPLSGMVSLQSTGGDLVWMAGTTVSVSGVGNNQFVMGATAGDSGWLTLSGDSTSVTDMDQVDVWGSLGTRADIDKSGNMPALVYGGGSDLSFSGGNTTLVFGPAAAAGTPTGVVWPNGNPPTGGNASILSTGNDTVWAGGVHIGFTTANSGTDHIILGTGSVTGTSSNTSTATLDVDDQGNGGAFVYSAGSETLNVTLTAATGNISAGSGTTTLNALGSSHLTFIGGSGSAILDIDDAAATVIGGQGTLNVSALSGSLTLDFAGASRGTLSIDGNRSAGGTLSEFDASKDSISFLAGSVISAHALPLGGITINLADGNHVTVSGVSSLNGITATNLSGQSVTLT